ncbi:MAG: autotransporter domain-containing protein, partial [Akkermansia sp.]|nr:autotransporter domain-containing protein [Akkermansia sp.]
TSVIITGGTIANNVYGAGDGDTVKGSTYVEINGGTVEGNVYGGGKNGSVVENDATVKLLSGDVKGTVSGEGADETSTVNGNKTLIVGSEEKAYIGTVGNIEGFDEIHVSTGSALNLTDGNAFTITEQNITLSESNLTQAAITTSTANVEAPLTLTLGFEGTLRSGKYMIISTEEPVEGWTPENVTVNGIAGFNDLKWEGNILSFVFQGGDADAMTTANWGVFKSTQAFTNVLWAPRAADSCLALPGQKDTMAWGSIYSHNSRIGSNGADYSIYGGAIGVEKGLKANRFIGAALGYDWGKVKPFSTTAVTQESFHLAGYGRAWHWCPNSTDAVSINWSAAYGRTTSEHSSIPGDWTQDNLQLDARATYYRALNNRTTVNGFVGAQYYAQDSDTTGAYKAKAMQNLRFMLGGGISYELTEKTTLYGEVALHQDVDRHNPSVSANGARFHCTNPGKFGCTVTGGAEYRINDSWSLRANYDFSTADDQTEHNINVGASYKF